MMNFRYTWRFVVFTVVLLFLTFPVAAADEPRALNGALDLTGWDFTRQGPVNLDGEWEFYWNQMLEPKDFLADPRPNRTGLFDVPAPWNNYRLGEKNLPGQGYATFRLLIKLPPDGELKACNIPYMSTAYRLWLNGKLIAENGQVGINRDDMKPEYRTMTMPLWIDGQNAELVLQVSNFYHRRGGFWQSIEMGNLPQVMAKAQKSLAANMFLFGSFMLMGLYHLGMFLFDRKNRIALFFSLFNILISLRSLLVGDVPITRFLPGLNWEILIKAEYLTMYLAVPVILHFVRALYREETNVLIYHIYLFLGGIFSLLVLVTPVRVFSRSLLIYQIILISALIFIFFILIQAVRHKRIGAVYLLAVAPLVILATLNDVLYYNQLVKTANLSPWGVFVFILTQSLVIAGQNKRTQELAVRDPLTKIYNRNYLYPELEHQVKHAKQGGYPLSLVVTDLDNFKMYNDSYGHLNGDKLLKTVAEYLKKNIRSMDVLARFGGDEFVLLFPYTEYEETRLLMERLVGNLKNVLGAEADFVSLSYGISCFPRHGEEINTLLEIADKALYIAKEERNQLKIF